MMTMTMRKKYYGLAAAAFLLLLLLLMVVSGCGCNAEEEGAGNGAPRDGKDTPAELTPEQAKLLATEALEKVLYLMSGGEKNAGSFERDGQELIYLEAEIGTTKAAVKKYLESCFTPKQAEILIEELCVTEHDGRLVIPGGSGGGIITANLDNLDLTLKSEDPRRPVYRFRLADISSDNYFTLTFTYVGGKWLIDDKDFDHW
ncbi:MAG: DL-endopeptidase inhibitor IseA family protein [Dethiobacteria bacterium]